LRPNLVNVSISSSSKGLNYQLPLPLTQANVI
jgi:hypothetical protein